MCIRDSLHSLEVRILLYRDGEVMWNSRNVLSLSNDGWDTFMVSRNIVRIYDSDTNWHNFVAWEPLCGMIGVYNVYTAIAHVGVLYGVFWLWCAAPFPSYLVHEMRSCMSLCRSTTVHLRLSNPVTVKASHVSGRNILRCIPVLNLSWRETKENPNILGIVDFDSGPAG